MSLELESVRRPLPTPSSASFPVRGASPGETDGPSRFASVLSALGNRVDTGEALMNRASRGALGNIDAASLIAVQAGIYRYVEAVDLAARLVDRATNAVRTVLQSSH